MASSRGFLRTVNREPRRFLHGFEHDRGARRLDAGNAGEAVTEQLTDVLGVTRTNFQHVAIVACNVMDFEYLWTLGQRVGDAVVTRRLLTSDGHKREHRLFEGMGIDQRGVAADDPPGFQL